MAEYSTKSIIDISEDSFTVLSGSVSLVDDELVFSGAGCCRFTYNYNTTTSKLSTDSILVKYNLTNSDDSLSSRYTDTFKIKIYVKYYSQVESNGQLSYTDGPSCTYQVYPYYNFEYLGYKDKVALGLKGSLIKSIIIELENTTSSTANLIKLGIYNEQTIDEKITETTTESLLDKEYSTLETTDKTVIGAINEVYLSGVRNFTITSESQLTSLTSAKPGDTATLYNKTGSDIGTVWETPIPPTIEGATQIKLDGHILWNIIRKEYYTTLSYITDGQYNYTIATSKNAIDDWQIQGTVYRDMSFTQELIGVYNNAAYLNCYRDDWDGSKGIYKLNLSDYSRTELMGGDYMQYGCNDGKDDWMVKTKSGRIVFTKVKWGSSSQSYICYTDDEFQTYSTVSGSYYGDSLAYDEKHDRVYFIGNNIRYADASNLSDWTVLDCGVRTTVTQIKDNIIYVTSRDYHTVCMFNINTEEFMDVDTSEITEGIYGEARVSGPFKVNNKILFTVSQGGQGWLYSIWELTETGEWQKIEVGIENRLYVDSINGIIMKDSTVVICGYGSPDPYSTVINRYGIPTVTINKGAWILVNDPTNRGDWLRIDNSI